MQNYSHFFFSKNISVYAIFNDQSFNNMLANDILILNNWAHLYKMAENLWCVSSKIQMIGHAQLQKYYLLVLNMDMN